MDEPSYDISKLWKSLSSHGAVLCKERPIDARRRKMVDGIAMRT